MKLLILEDDIGLNRGISYALTQEGYEISSAQTMKEGFTIFEKESPDAILLDLNLPDGDGIDFCKKIRSVSGSKSETPILMLTARDMEVDEIMGLTSGADDYITKPFSVSILKIRLQNILNRKQNKTKPQNMLQSGDISIDKNTLRAFYKQQELDLSITEFRLLQYFLENKNQALLKEQILQHIWDMDGNYVEENTLSVNISRLRKKLGKDYIRTIPGIGYLWEEKA
ncbi:MAG: response regulator transcription factor [Blautia sp.]|nr:response regulator transcription factor [Lachnoclostridium sp.]MCM1211374.1 response regulator transcription factor [Blautia sp.]